MRKYNKLIPITIICGGIIFVVIGAVSGELTNVLNTATRVCLECIGIG